MKRSTGFRFERRFERQFVGRADKLAQIGVFERQFVGHADKLAQIGVFTQEFVGHADKPAQIGVFGRQFVGHADKLAQIGVFERQFVGHADKLAQIGVFTEEFVGHADKPAQIGVFGRQFVGHADKPAQIGVFERQFVGPADKLATNMLTDHRAAMVYSRFGGSNGLNDAISLIYVYPTRFSPQSFVTVRFLLHQPFICEILTVETRYDRHCIESVGVPSTRVGGIVKSSTMIRRSRR